METRARKKQDMEETIQQLMADKEALFDRCKLLEEKVKKETCTGELENLFLKILGSVKNNSNKMYNINPSQQKFFGKSIENISEWLITMDGNLRYGGVADEDKLGVATTYLGGAALQAYRRLSSRSGVNIIT